MKHINYHLLMLSLFLCGCELYDLRKDAGTTHREKDKIDPHEIISKCVSAHGWDNLDSAWFTVTYIDKWPNFWFRIFFHPWPDKNKLLKQEFPLYSLHDAELIFTEGVRKGEVWGLENKQPYLKANGKKVFRQHSDTRFYLPTYQYFIQMPYWLQQVPVLKYLGQERFNGQDYHLIYGTWKQEAPSKKFDQYLYWINVDTYFLEMVQYTIRDQMPNAHGTNTFSEFKKVDQLIIPFKQTITFNPGDEAIMHQIIVKEIHYKKFK